MSLTNHHLKYHYNETPALYQENVTFAKIQTFNNHPISEKCKRLKIQILKNEMYLSSNIGNLIFCTRNKNYQE